MSENKWWLERPWRMIQTNLRQTDMEDISARQVVADLEWFGANVLMINTSGIIAGYPTEHPFHTQSGFLHGDSLSRIIDACHEKSIRVIARMDFSKVRRPLYERHPEWAYVGTDGSIVDYNGDVHVCFNSRYQQVHSFEIMEETLRVLPVDGVFFNFGGYTSSYDYSGNLHGDCQCANCKARFKEMYGTELPPEAGRNIPEQYARFKNETTAEYRKKIFSTLKKLRPGLCIANFPDQNDGFVRSEAGTSLFSPQSNWCYESSELNKASGAGSEMLTSITTVDFWDISYRLAAVSPHQQQLRLAQSMANGNALDYYLIGRLDNHEDKSGFAPIREVYQYHKKNWAHYTGLTSVADVLLVKPPGYFLSDKSIQDEYRGWFKALTENHYLFDCLTETGLASAGLSGYKLVVLPAVSVSDEAARRLEAYARQGGKILATGLNPATNETLARVLAVDKLLCERSGIRSAYFRDGGGLVYLHERYVYAEYAAHAEKKMQMIPPCNFGPPERCYYETVTDYPAWVINGGAVYMPWYPGTQYFKNNQLSIVQLMAKALRGAAGVLPACESLPPQIELTVSGTADGNRLVHLINETGFFGGAYHRPLTLKGLSVVLETEVRPSAVTRLTDGKELTYTWKEGKLSFELETLELFTAVRIVREHDRG